MSESSTSAAVPPHVLVVEDERINAVIIQRLLAREQYRVTLCGSAEEALEAIAGDPPDVILLDVVLPGMTGIEACRKLQANPVTAAIPVVFLTALTGAEEVAEAFEAGGTDYIPKPFRPPETLARIRTQLRLRQLRKAQERVIRELEAANEARNKFLGMAAHDLRSPLSGIRGLAEMLEEGDIGPVTDEQRETAAQIARAARSMLGLINDLLDLATVQAGVFRLVPTEQDPRQLVERTVFLNGAAARRKGITLVPDTHQAPAVWRYDADRLQQVMDNLISNAIKYSPTGTTVSLEVKEEQGGLEVTVEDEGSGVPESERDQLFRDYGRTSVRPTGGEQSTGLGLAICARIVAAHSGKIGFRGRAGGGSVFWFRLPA